MLKALVHGLADCPRFREPQAGLRIRALVRRDEAGDLSECASGIEIVKGDLRRATDCAELCQKAKGALLIHTAGIIHPRRVRDFFEINVEGTRNLLTAATEAGVRRAVVISSNSPIGCNPHPDHLFDEDSPYRPYMAYGRSKMQMELLVGDLQAAGLIETIVIRAPWFYGPFQPPRQTLFFRMIRDSKAPIVGGGENLRSLVYIDNLVQGLLLAATNPKASGETYWIADARPYSMNEIVDTVERLLETEFGQICRHRRLRIPGLASEIAWLADAGLQAVGQYNQKIHVLSEMNKAIACTIAKAKNDLAYTPTVALEEGMRRSLRWLFESQQKL